MRYHWMFWWRTLIPLVNKMIRIIYIRELSTGQWESELVGIDWSESNGRWIFVGQSRVRFLVKKWAASLDLRLAQRKESEVWDFRSPTTHHTICVLSNASNSFTLFFSCFIDDCCVMLQTANKCSYRSNGSVLYLHNMICFHFGSRR